MNTLLLYGIIALVALGALAGITYKVHHAGYESGIAECERKAKLQRDAEAKQSGAASTKLEGGNAKARVVYRTITQKVDKIVERPVYRNVCLDDDGLLAANSALGGALAPPRKPDATVPKPDGARGWFRGLRPAKVD